MIRRINRAIRPVAFVIVVMATSLAAQALGGIIEPLADAATAAHSQAKSSAPRVRLVLANGDTLTGALVARTPTSLIIRHFTLGELTIPLAQIVFETAVSPLVHAKPSRRIEPEKAAPGPVAPTSRTDINNDKILLAPAKRATWSGRLEFGLSAASGNTVRSDTRFAVALSRKALWSTLDLSASYRFTTENSKTATNRFFAQSRNVWRLANSRWTRFARSSIEFDEFQDYNARAAVAAGFGYNFINTDQTKLTGRAGGGFAREFGGSDTRLIPESLLEIEFARELTRRQRVSASAELTPDLGDLFQYRVKSKLAWEIDLNDAKTWKLKAALEDRFDSSPGDAERNDIEYILNLVYSF